MLVLDHDRAGGYWGAVYVFTAIKGLQVVIDGPVGCENLPVTSVLHYTDALPPHELPIVVTGLAEEQLGREGTEGAMRAPMPRSTPTCPSVVVTGSIAEMIGGGVTPVGHQHPALPAAHHRRRPVAVRQPRDVLAVVRVRREARCPRASRWPSARRARSRASTSSARATAPSTPSDLAEIRRLVQGIGAESTWCSRWAATWPTYRAWSRPTSTSACTASSAACCARRWSGPTCRHRSAAQHHQVPAHAGRAAGPGPRALHRAREAQHDQADVGSVALGHPGLLRHRQLRGGGQRDLHPRHPALPRRRDWACPATSRWRASRAPRPTTTRCASWCTRQDAAGDVRQLQRAHVPGRVRWRLDDEAHLHPGVVPAAIIRRHTGTPFMGYAGATYLVQEFCNALFDALFHILPLGTDLDRVDPTPARDRREQTRCRGTTGPGRCWRYVAAEPVLVQISAAKRLRDLAENGVPA
jgi:chlorophyllide a reductase subunit Z